MTNELPITFDYGFEPTDKTTWLKALEKELKGKDISTLFWEAGDIIISPFFHSSDQSSAPQPIEGQGHWLIGQDILVSNPEKTNEQLLKALEGGVTSPALVFNQQPSKEDLNSILSGVQLSLIELHVKGIHPTEDLLPQDCVVHVKSVQAIHSNRYKWSLDIKNESGSDQEGIQGLQNALADCVTLFKKGDISPTELYVTIGIGKNYFFEIARLRAWQIVWANLCKHLAMPMSAPQLDVYLSDTSLVENVASNMISTTTQTMAAVMGMASRVTVTTSDHASAPYGDAFSQRIARNVQQLLQLEGYFGKVNDPAAGSYFIEHLTDLLAQRIWNK